MAREKQYSTNAEKQAAYRARHPEKMPPRDAYLAALVRSLHSTIHDAAATGDPLAQEVAGDRTDETLQKLIRHFRPPSP